MIESSILTPMVCHQNAHICPPNPGRRNARNDHATLAEVAYPYNAFVKVVNLYPYGMSSKRAHAPWVFVLKP